MLGDIVLYLLSLAVGVSGELHEDILLNVPLPNNYKIYPAK
jgi:hypothetical protein